MNEMDIINWFAEINYDAMLLINDYWWLSWTTLFLLGGLLGMSPLKTHYTHSFFEISAVIIRRGILLTALPLIFIPFLTAYIYSATSVEPDPEQAYIDWFVALTKKQWWFPIAATALGLTLRFLFNRYCMTTLSALFRKLTKKQTKDNPSDIKDQQSKYKPKKYRPQQYQNPEKGMFVGLSEDNKPIYIPSSTWRETNMKVLGPTRFGKGILLGGIMDQVIKNQDTLFYIDPKSDQFAPHVMYQACQQAGRKFYYVSLHDEELGSWAPFTGGSEKDAFSRLLIAFGIELTGEPKTDFYKRQEIKILSKIFSRTRRVEGLLNEIENTDAHTAEAELEIWSGYKSLCPAQNQGFSVEKAIKENAVVYLKGDLDDRVIKTATKTFIVELVQEARRLFKAQKRNQHITTIVDEVSFLTSKQLKEAMATIVGFDVNFVLAYQSEEDLINVEDININGHALQHSIDVNSQIKAIYGGSNYQTAEWAAKLSGTTQKTVTKYEKTNTKSGGGEAWEPNRTVGALEENLIHPNVILTLPPSVCVFVQPGRLLEPLFPSFIEIEDMTALPNFLEKKTSPSTFKESDPEDNSNTENSGFSGENGAKTDNHQDKKTVISHEKSTAKEQTENEQKRKDRNKRRRQKQKEKKRAGDEKIEPISHEKSQSKPEQAGEGTHHNEPNNEEDELLAFLENS